MNRPKLYKTLRGIQRVRYQSLKHSAIDLGHEVIPLKI